MDVKLVTDWTRFILAVHLEVREAIRIPTETTEDEMQTMQARIRDTVQRLNNLKRQITLGEVQSGVFQNEFGVDLGEVATSLIQHSLQPAMLTQLSAALSSLEVVRLAIEP